MTQGEIDELREQILLDLAKIEKEIDKHSVFGTGVHNGEVYTYFSCHCDPDNPSYYQYEYGLEFLEHLKRLEPLFEPNKIDPRKVKRGKEFRGKTVVNLGNKVNRLPSNVLRI
jgi:hypothetical protein